MSGVNGGQPRSLGEGYEMLSKSISELKTVLELELKASRGELRVLSARLDGLAGEIRTTRTVVDQMSDRIHKTNNLLLPLISEVSELHSARIAFERATAKIVTLERMQGLLEQDVDVLQDRTRMLRREITTDEGEDSKSGDPQ